MKFVLLLLFAASAYAKLPNLVFNLIDDWGWANVGFHRDAGFPETVTPNMDSLVQQGILLNQYYVHKYCSPSRSSYQSGRFPYHVNVLNDDMSVANPADPVSGFAGIPRNMTGIAEKLKTAGYSKITPFFISLSLFFSLFLSSSFFSFSLSLSLLSLSLSLSLALLLSFSFSFSFPLFLFFSLNPIDTHMVGKWDAGSKSSFALTSTRLITCSGDPRPHAQGTRL